MNNQEIYESIYRLGKSFFINEELSEYLELIKGYDLSFLSHFSCMTQDKELVQLETSFLTDKIVYDFTLAKGKCDISLIPINKITFIQNTIYDNQKMVVTIFSNEMWLKYMTFNKHDTDLLMKYSIVLTNKLNNI